MSLVELESYAGLTLYFYIVYMYWYIEILMEARCLDLVGSLL